MRLSLIVKYHPFFAHPHIPYLHVDRLNHLSDSTLVQAEFLNFVHKHFNLVFQEKSFRICNVPWGKLFLSLIWGRGETPYVQVVNIEKQRENASNRSIITLLRCDLGLYWQIHGHVIKGYV